MIGKKGYLVVRCCTEGSHMKEKEEHLSWTCNLISLNPDQSCSSTLSLRGNKNLTEEQYMLRNIQLSELHFSVGLFCAS